MAPIASANQDYTLSVCKVSQVYKLPWTNLFFLNPVNQAMSSAPFYSGITEGFRQLIMQLVDMELEIELKPGHSDFRAYKTGV